VVGKALRTGNASPPFLSIQLSEATEADLLAAKSACPDQAHRVDGWIKFLKQNAEPPPPIQVQFLNAAELQKTRFSGFIATRAASSSARRRTGFEGRLRAAEAVSQTRRRRPIHCLVRCPHFAEGFDLGKVRRQNRV